MYKATTAEEKADVEYQKVVPSKRRTRKTTNNSELNSYSDSEKKKMNNKEKNSRTTAEGNQVSNLKRGEARMENIFPIVIIQKCLTLNKEY